MPSSYTNSLSLTLPATGELSGTWGTTVNNGITTLVDDALAGTASITVGGSDYTLTATQGAANEARKMFIVATGSPGAARNVIVPAVSKLYFVYNNTTGGYALTFKTPSGTGISVANGARMVLYCDGTNVVNALNAITLASPLPTTSGGTGLSSFTSGGVLYASSTSALTTGSALVFDGTRLGVGTGTPSAKLHVSDGTNAKLLIGSGGTSENYFEADTQIWRNGASSAERMRITATGNLGIGTATPSAKLHVIDGTTAALLIGSGGASENYFDANTQFWRSGNGLTERMRLNSSGYLGIGTTTPQLKFVVSDAGGAGLEVDPTGLSSAPLIQSYNRSGAAYTQLGFDGLQYVWRASGSEKMRLDSSGNVGLGVTPNTWTGDKALQLPYGAISSGFAYSVTVASVAYRDTSWKYQVNSQAPALYEQIGGAHKWFSAASGTAGGAITWSQNMTLDASGNLGIGSTSPLATIEAKNASYFPRAAFTKTAVGTWYVGGDGSGSTNNFQVTLNATTMATVTSGGEFCVNTSAAKYNAKFNVKGTGTASVPTNLSDLSGALILVESNKANVGYAGVGYNDSDGGGAAVVFGRGGSYDTNILFMTNAAGTGTAGAMSERARIDSSGNFGVGTTSPISGAGVTIGNDSSGSATVKLAFSTSGSERGSISMAGGGGEMRLTSGYSGYGGLMTFYANGSERMRIDSSGNLITTVNGTAPTLSTNSTMSFELTSNTSLKIVVRGTDGTTRSATLTLA